jgi:hypothetical protein
MQNRNKLEMNFKKKISFLEKDFFFEIHFQFISILHRVNN